MSKTENRRSEFDSFILARRFSTIIRSTDTVARPDVPAIGGVVRQRGRAGRRVPANCEGEKSSLNSTIGGRLDRADRNTMMTTTL